MTELPEEVVSEQRMELAMANEVVWTVQAGMSERVEGVGHVGE